MTDFAEPHVNPCGVLNSPAFSQAIPGMTNDR